MKTMNSQNEPHEMEQDFQAACSLAEGHYEVISVNPGEPAFIHIPGERATRTAAPNHRIAYFLKAITWGMAWHARMPARYNEPILTIVQQPPEYPIGPSNEP